MPKLKEDIWAVADGEIHPRLFRAGEDVTGGVADAAKAQGKLQDEPKKKPGRPVSSKAMKAPENK